mmetsp:Transcript_83173/g.258299  ORF Transcript_83173/g.258299 Transcript_83173/m.258299 type:complete len:102 (-) Transcript_83173:38-343(-)
MATLGRLPSDPYLHPVHGYAGHPFCGKKPYAEKPNQVPMGKLLARSRSSPAMAGSQVVASLQNPFGIRDYRQPGAPAHENFVSSLHAPPGYVGFKPMSVRY